MSGWSAGDAVVAFLPIGVDGAAAEYAAAPAETLADAAALPSTGLTAWQALFDQAGLTAGQSILVNGASGAVGGYAVPEETAQLTDLVADGGTFLSTIPGPVTARDGVRTVEVFVRSDATELAGLVARVDAGDLKIYVAQRRPLADLAAVHHEADAGRLSGKTILTP